MQLRGHSIAMGTPTLKRLSQVTFDGGWNS